MFITFLAAVAVFLTGHVGAISTAIVWERNQAVAVATAFAWMLTIVTIIAQSEVFREYIG